MPKTQMTAPIFTIEHGTIREKCRSIPIYKPLSPDQEFVGPPSAKSTDPHLKLLHAFMKALDCFPDWKPTILDAVQTELHL